MTAASSVLARWTAAVGLGESAAIVVIVLAFAVPLFFQNPLLYSTVNQILVGTTASFSVFLMLRMGLLSFAVPAFMAIGGYAYAIASLKGGITNLFALAGMSFLLPALIAVPLAALVLRMRGVYFVLVTFVFSQILDLLLFELPTLTGGTNGLVGTPAPTLFRLTVDDNRSLLFMVLTVSLIAAAVTAAITRIYRQEFAAIRENEVLAQSLGLVVWRYKTLGFVVAAGIAGLAGFSLVNILLTAHPASFRAISSVNYIVYTIIGGAGSMLGPIVGSALLVSASEIFSVQGEYSRGLYGILVVVVVLLAKTGIVGTVDSLGRRMWASRRKRDKPPNAAHGETLS